MIQLDVKIEIHLTHFIQHFLTEVRRGIFHNIFHTIHAVRTDISFTPVVNLLFLVVEGV